MITTAVARDAILGIPPPDEWTGELLAKAVNGKARLELPQGGRSARVIVEANVSSSGHKVAFAVTTKGEYIDVRVGTIKPTGPGGLTAMMKATGVLELDGLVAGKTYKLRVVDVGGAVLLEKSVPTSNRGAGQVSSGS